MPDREQAGFTLIEVMVALVVLAIGGLGALQAMILASQNLKNGQFDQIKASLAEAHSNSFLLGGHSLLITPASVNGYGMTPLPPPVLFPAIGVTTTPSFIIDPTPNIFTAPLPTYPNPNAIDSGPFFSATPDGTVTQVDWSGWGLGSPATCGDPLIPVGIFCREIMVTAGLPATTFVNGWEAVAGGLSPGWGTVYTLWTRVSRKPAFGQDLHPALYQEVIAQ